MVPKILARPVSHLQMSPEAKTQRHGHKKAQKAQKQSFIESFVPFRGSISVAHLVVC
jgi:hypothetical protein